MRLALRSDGRGRRSAPPCPRERTLTLRGRRSRSRDPSSSARHRHCFRGRLADSCNGRAEGVDDRVEAEHPVADLAQREHRRERDVGGDVVLRRRRCRSAMITDHRKCRDPGMQPTGKRREVVVRRRVAPASPVQNTNWSLKRSIVGVQIRRPPSACDGGDRVGRYRRGWCRVTTRHLGRPRRPVHIGGRDRSGARTCTENA